MRQMIQDVTVREVGRKKIVHMAVIHRVVLITALDTEDVGMVIVSAIAVTVDILVKAYRMIILSAPRRVVAEDFVCPLAQLRPLKINTSAVVHVALVGHLA